MLRDDLSCGILEHMTIANRVCVQCGNPYRGQGLKFCSQTCFHKHQVGIPINLGSTPWNKGIKWDKLSKDRMRSGNPAWKGGVQYRGGYKFILLPDHPNANKRGYIAEHRLVMANLLGRPLKSSEQVHHIDHDITNNDPTNLVILSRSEHMKLHRNERA